MPDTYRRFVAEFGWIVAGPIEIFGIGTDVPDFMNMMRLALSERSEMHPPLASHLLPVMNDGGGDLYCIDCSLSDPDPPIVIRDHDTGGLSRARPDADHFTTWLLALVRPLSEDEDILDELESDFAVLRDALEDHRYFRMDLYSPPNDAAFRVCRTLLTCSPAGRERVVGEIVREGLGWIFFIAGGRLERIGEEQRSLDLLEASLVARAINASDHRDYRDVVQGLPETMQRISKLGADAAAMLHHVAELFPGEPARLLLYYEDD
jgi:hypothetical protein